MNSRFSIVSVSEDTLYANEQFTVSVNASGLNVSDLRLLAHTTEFAVDTVVGTTIYARAAKDVYGRLRLYHKDVEAEGEFRVFVHSRTFEEFLKASTGWAPMEGMAGDSIQAYWSIDLDSEKVEPRINDLPLQYLRTIGRYHYYRIPEGATDGWLTIVVNGRRGAYGYFDVILSGEPFLEPESIANAGVDAGGLFTYTRTDSLGVVSTSESTFLSLALNHIGGAFVVRSDSIRVVQNLIGIDTTQQVSMVFYQDTVSQLISGTMVMMWLDIARPTRRTVTIRFKDAPWRRKNGSSYMTLMGEEISRSLVSLHSRSEHLVSKRVTELTAYDFSGSSSFLNVIIGH